MAVNFWLDKRSFPGKISILNCIMGKAKWNYSSQENPTANNFW